MRLRLSRAAVIRLALSLVAGLVVVACGGSGTPASKAPSAPADTGPVDGGTVTLPIVADPTFNPWHPNAFVESIFINRVLFAGLTRPGKDLAPAPDLAEKWEVSGDGLTWTFSLRKDAKWSDGQPLTAEDVAFTFNDVVLNKSLGANGASRYAAVTRVEVVDPHTVRFRLSRPFSALPAYLAYNAGILPKHVFQGQDPWNLNSFNKGKPISSGPFKLESYTPGQNVVLVRNEHYFGGKPRLDKLVFKVVPDPNAQVAQVLSGELSILILDNKAAVERLKGASNVQVVARDLVQFYWLALNQNDPLFQDVRVRQALLHAIDRAAIIKSVEQGYATIANSPIPPALKAYYDGSLQSRYPYDPQKARELLAAAGWKEGSDGVLQKDGKPFKFVMDVGQKGNLQPVSELIQQYWKKVGVLADLNPMEWNAYIQKMVVRRQYQASVNWWVYPADPDVLPYFHSSAAEKGYNIPMYRDSKLDELLQKGQATADPGQRKAVYQQVQAYMADTLPYLFLWYPQEVVVMRTNLRGVPDLNLRDAMHYVQDWWLARG